MNYHEHNAKKPPLSVPVGATLTHRQHAEYQREMDEYSKPFYAHVFGCSSCFPWRGQYCETGEQLRQTYANASKSLRKRFLGAQNGKDALDMLFGFFGGLNRFWWISCN